jgi:hypothetical protein
LIFFFSDTSGGSIVSVVIVSVVIVSVIIVAAAIVMSSIASVGVSIIVGNGGSFSCIFLGSRNTTFHIVLCAGTGNRWYGIVILIRWMIG